ncbi:choloylglycine hydrolase family protein [Ancylobacter dichloromethanicus]|uniref:Choloylglycine hydrolase n=1 Tax=Ancylobacter dichloromethanicus TaxID=518825 RepID=A0A9W6N1H8_9HYPH|nr:choloylglycine hydrolase family protein [Ancylobacter dichloromethanicus]MBS7552476.1 choloylglycine hydrolase family protein [Ancylobacter dichloromethanicus]GLK74218.1 choloylglycine hydrolase [Ancylobacter dichloromethanicus]
MKRLLATTLALLATVNMSLACTAVDLVAKDGSVVAGRTMEWAFDMKWQLVSQPKGTELTLVAPAALDLPAHKVTTKYPVVGVNAGIIPGGALLDGQNSEGLSMSGNFLPGFTQYQTVTKDDKEYQTVLTFGSWALGSFATVAELRAALKTMKVWADDTLATGPTPATIHFVFVDRSGAGIVVEYVGGEVQIHDNVAHVLTNAPTYDWHLNNVRNYLSLSTVGVSSREVADVNVTELGQGGGMLGMPGDYTPPSRFVRATVLRHNATQPEDVGAAAQTVAHILNNVDIPIGIAQFHQKDGTLGSDYTQWIVVKDLTNNKLMIADYDNRLNYLTIDLAPLFAQTKPAARLVTELPYPKTSAGAEVLAP